jgi:ectoine utilization protein EutC
MELDDIIILSENELKRMMKLDLGVIARIEEGFAELSRGNAAVPPIMMLPVPELNGEVDIKSAFIKGLPSMAVKIASGFFQNPDRGLPSQSGQMLVISAETGFLQGVLLDNGYLTQVRTAAAGAIAAKYLAPEHVETVGVVGCGVQARFQMEALYLVRPFKKILMFSLDPPEREKAYAAEMEARLGITVERVASCENVVRGSSIVVTTTPARQGYLKAEWLHPGLHITSMGSDAEDKQELMPEVLGRADLLACDLKSQCFRLGELRGGLEAGIITRESPVTELGELVLGTRPGRTGDDQITVCDLTGVGVQDTMIAVAAYETAAAEEIGLRIKR